MLRQRRPDVQQKRECRRSQSSKVRKKNVSTIIIFIIISYSPNLIFGVEALLGHDQQICNTLEEKLQLYAELTELTLNSSEPVAHRHLLVPPDSDSEIPPQATSLLTAALREGRWRCCVVWTLMQSSLTFYKHNNY